MDKWTYLILDIIFFIPIFLIFILRYRKILFTHIKFILFSGLLGSVLFFVIDLPGTRWNAWTMNYSKTFRPIFDTSVFEELIWVILVFMVVAMVIEIVLSEK